MCLRQSSEREANLLSLEHSWSLIWHFQFSQRGLSANACSCQLSFRSMNSSVGTRACKLIPSLSSGVSFLCCGAPSRGLCKCKAPRDSGLCWKQPVMCLGAAVRGNTRHARGPTSPRSTGFCVMIWGCISSSSPSVRRGAHLRHWQLKPRAQHTRSAWRTRDGPATWHVAQIMQTAIETAQSAPLGFGSRRAFSLGLQRRRGRLADLPPPVAAS